jgi:L-alanine-DL-glutamate epimerase-like enolase superfamily enzyme
MVTQRVEVGGDGEMTGFEVIPYALPFAEPYVSARGTLRRREIVLLKLHTSDGLVGLGEAVPLALRGGDPFGRVARELMELRNEYTAAWGPEERTAILGRASGSMSAPARCAFFTAWLDLAAKWHEIPMWQMLGADRCEPVRCNATLVAGSPEDVVADAERWAKAGFGTFKVKVGPRADTEQVRAVRAALGAEARIRIDANGSWDVEMALGVLGSLQEVGLELVEQPASTLEELAAIKGKSTTRVCADESIANFEDAERAIELSACDMATLKLSKVGGPEDAIGIAGTIGSFLSSALDGPVGIAAAAHTAQALAGRCYGQSWADGRTMNPGVAHGLATQRLFADTIASVECELHGDMLHLPEGPGLGVEIDDAALGRHRL